VRVCRLKREKTGKWCSIKLRRVGEDRVLKGAIHGGGSYAKNVLCTRCCGHCWCVCVWYLDGLSDTETHPLILLPCGLAAGCLAAMVTHPADVIKTHLQLKRAHGGATRHTVNHILQVDVLQVFRQVSSC